jgi:hypothetical protein
MITYIAAFADAIVGDHLDYPFKDEDEFHDNEYHPRDTRKRPRKQPLSLPELENFILIICERSNLNTPTLMTSIVYLTRLRARMPTKAAGMYISWNL